jgi:hypothetical protein
MAIEPQFRPPGPRPRQLPGDPSDQSPAVLDLGQGDISMGVFAMTTRFPTDEENLRYLEWHALDHLPEQYRLKGIRLGSRWVSTPACRAARAYDSGPFQELDHVVNYLVTEPLADSLDRFWDLMVALTDVGRMTERAKLVHTGHYEVMRKLAAPRVVAGADVLPWRPARGIYLAIESAPEGTDERIEELDALTEIDGVVGFWRYAGGVVARPPKLPGSAPDMRITVCYLDAPPLEMAGVLGEAFKRRWADGRLAPLLAAPLEVVTPWQWERHLP